ncbi:MAG TPA: hypothetical protein VJJ98_11640 [Sedimentisphaerales bacterium]|nr:hypothetical protein [Sedimentisphaerales bacterium]
MNNDRTASDAHWATVVLALGTFLALVVTCGGCGMPSKMSVGGYKHQDMSKSRYRDIMLEQAETLAGTTNPEDWRTAAKYYGSIGMLGEMDHCISKYVEKEPELGGDLIYVGDQIHQFYEGRKR